MATLHFSLPLVAEIDMRHPTMAAVAPYVSEEIITDLLTASVAMLPEFTEFLKTVNDGGSWCVVDIDKCALSR